MTLLASQTGRIRTSHLFAFLLRTSRWMCGWCRWLSSKMFTLWRLCCFAGADADHFGLQHSFPHLGHIGERLICLKSQSFVYLPFFPSIHYFLSSNNSFSIQIVILKLRQKAVTAADHDRRHWKAAKVNFFSLIWFRRFWNASTMHLSPPWLLTLKQCSFRRWYLWCLCSVWVMSWPCWSTLQWEALGFLSWSPPPTPWRPWSRRRRASSSASPTASSTARCRGRWGATGGGGGWWGRWGRTRARRRTAWQQTPPS